MKNLKILLLSIFIFQLGNSQSIKSRLSLNISPFSAIEYQHPYYRLGGKYRLTNSLFISIDIGYANSIIIKTISEDYSFKAIRPEISYAVLHKDNIYYYWAVEYYFFECQFQKNGLITNNNKFFYVQNSILTKIKEGFNFKIGFNSIFLSYFYADLYMGMGFYQKNNKISLYGKVEQIDEIRHISFPTRIGFLSGYQPVFRLKNWLQLLIIKEGSFVKDYDFCLFQSLNRRMQDMF